MQVLGRECERVTERRVRKPLDGVRRKGTAWTNVSCWTLP